MSAPLCQAKIPLAIFPRTWQICGRDAVTQHVYRCRCGHERTGTVCAEHVPAAGMLGCSQCFDAGHECPMEASRWP